ncbi:hypothetical protein JXA12_00850 [Candidatus Woesearchaeota archaeon]|nr:hypothetical protein [Candidatus Woesearchaeota archaeon]
MESLKASHLLRIVDEGCAFHFCNGKQARDLRGLRKGIVGLDEAGYHHHVYQDHNDFTNWLLDIIGDEQLARDLFNATKQQAASLLQARIHYLENHSS